MAYNPNIPQPSNQLSQSQSDMLQNFTALQTLIDVNHVDFSDGDDQGKHKWVTFPLQESAPSFNAGEVGLYNLNFATTSTNELFLNSQNGTNIPTTASTLSTNAAPAQNSGGWTYLPSGLILKFGSFTGNSGLSTVTLSGATIPVYTQILSVIVCAYSTATTDQNFAVRLGPILSNTQFQVYISARTTTGSATGGFQFLAIGY